MQRQPENPVQPSRWSIVAALAVWTLLIGGGLLWILQEDRQRMVELARAEARSVLRQTLQFRRWLGGQDWQAVPSRPFNLLSESKRRVVARVKTAGQRLASLWIFE